jgi:chromosome segregation ATPase
MGAEADRLQSIQDELNNILQERIAELHAAMTSAEEKARQIVASELEAARIRQVRSELDGRIAGVRSDLGALTAQAAEVRASHSAAVSERDSLQEDFLRLRRETEQAESEVQQTRIQTRKLEKESDSLRQENVELKLKLRTLEDNVGRMRRLREELLSSMSSLTQQMSSLASPDKV